MGNNEDRVRKLKRVLLVGPYVAVLIPIILCIVLFVLLTVQNNRIKTMEAEMADARSTQDSILLETGDTQVKVSELNGKVDELSDEFQKFVDAVYSISSQSEGRDPNAWPKKVYLTFDDGPSANTERILDILDQYGVKGTFFVVGTQSDNLKKMYKRIVEEGHTIGMHSYSHKYSDIYASKEAFTEDLDRIYKLIVTETGVEPRIYRFPGGSSNNVSRVPMEQLEEILSERKITYYDWNVLSGDATNPVLPVEDIISNSLNNVSDYEEAIILFHDLSNKTTTVEALPKIIESLLEQGITIAPIDETTMLIQHNTNKE